VGHDRKGEWSYDENHTKPEFDMVVPLPNGSVESIDHLPVTEAKARRWVSISVQMEVHTVLYSR
jgi:hypothetical protein